jgi:hypothetical protein
MPLTDREVKAIKLMERIGGGFASKLATAWHHADAHNSERLKKAFPELLSDYCAMVDAGHGL